MLLVLPGASAEEICKLYHPEPAALAVLNPGDRPTEFLEKLTSAALIDAAIDFLANAIPRREAAWWAVRCARGAWSETPPPPSQAALKAAEAWVLQPTEENRRKCEAAADLAGYDDPAGLAAAAVFLSGGSLGPPGFAEVPPPPGSMARAVAGVIALAAALGPPERIEDAKREAVALGLKIAEREDRWKS